MYRASKRLEYRLNDGDEMSPLGASLTDRGNSFDPSLLNAMDRQLPSAQIFQQAFNAQTSLAHIQIPVGNLKLKKKKKKTV